MQPAADHEPGYTAGNLREACEYEFAAHELEYFNQHTTANSAGNTGNQTEQQPAPGSEQYGRDQDNHKRKGKRCGRGEGNQGDHQRVVTMGGAEFEKLPEPVRKAARCHVWHAVIIKPAYV